ncbi:MAG: PqqD family protein, partial [Candidatus Acidiferrum sp.]
MNNKRYVARSTAIAARALGDETMVMSATNSTLFTLNEVATVIWEAADGATPLEEIVANKICLKYDVAPEVALKDAEGVV